MSTKTPISEAAREAALNEMRDQSDWIPGRERPALKEDAAILKEQETKDIAKAKRDSKKPQRQCCFGIADTHGARCANQSVSADTFHGFTTGLSWCSKHNQKEWLSNWPHAQIPMS